MVGHVQKGVCVANTHKNEVLVAVVISVYFYVFIVAMVHQLLDWEWSISKKRKCPLDGIIFSEHPMEKHPNWTLEPQCLHIREIINR